jgi:16S rRNA (cytosine967-C5)-methyltransferase
MPPRARDLAVWALQDRAGNVSAHLDRLLAESDLAAEDEGLARELALGTVRRRGTLDAVLRGFLRRPDQRMPAVLRHVLHVALYQLLFLDRVPAFAAVNEAVEQASRVGRGSARGMANAVLRAVCRGLSPPADGAVAFAPDVIPIAPRRFRTIDRPVFPDPGEAPAAYLAAAFSLPRVLAGRWVERFGGAAGAGGVATHANARAPQILRVNRLRGDVAGVVAALAGEGVEALVHANGASVVMSGHCNIAELAAFREGLVQPQDPTATEVVLAAAARPGMAVLDFCAAPGTKTTHLAECMEGRGAITALDVSPEKLARIDQNCRRMGVGIVTTRLADQAGALPPESFDLVLVDAPCTNTGVLARRAEARWRFDEAALRRLVRDQKSLLAAAAVFVRPGGRLLYSTCSIEPEECGEMASWLRQKTRHLTKTAEKLTMPGGADDPTHWRDGGYYAIFRRS